MKTSEIIRIALDEYYVTDKKHLASNDAGRREEYMCHAIEQVLIHKCGVQGVNAVEASQVHKQTFMPQIKAHHTACLTVMLQRTEPKYKAMVNRYNDYVPSCIRRRVEWWENHIETLKAQGL